MRFTFFFDIVDNQISGRLHAHFVHICNGFLTFRTIWMWSVLLLISKGYHCSLISICSYFFKCSRTYLFGIVHQINDVYSVTNSIQIRRSNKGPKIHFNMIQRLLPWCLEYGIKKCCYSFNHILICQSTRLN